MKSALALAILGLLASSFYVVGDDLTTDPAAAAAPTAEQIDQWVSELGDTRFSTRRDATDALVTAGLPAIEPVVSAALEGTAEVAVRCVQILRRLKDSADLETSEAAVAGLRTLADSNNALVNERALAALDESSFEDVPQPQFGGVQIQIQAGAVIGGGVSVRTRVTNGQRTINVDDAVNDKEIEIRDQDGEDIEITVTETVNGEETTTEYEAADLDDLKQNHPEIADLYEEYTQQNAPVIQVFGGQFQQIPLQLPQQAFPVPFGPPMPADEDENQQAAADLGSAVERFDDAIARLEELSKADEPDEDALAEVIAELNAIRAELAETQDQLND